MRITAQIQNVQNRHEISLKTNDNAQSINIPPKASGFGSSVNGGELSFLALATCYCLMKRTDSVAEIQNTLRTGTLVILNHAEAVSV